MKAWRLERLGGKFSFTETPKPEVRPGSVLVRVEAVSLVSYLKAYVEGRLPHYRAPDGTFTPGGNCVGTIEAVGRDVWHLKPGQRAIVSSFLVASENVPDPAQMLIGMTAFGGASADMQADWRDGTLAEYVLSPVPAVTPVTDLDALPAEQLVIASRCVVPLGGLMRGRLAAGETLIITGATGAFGAGAILVAIALGAGRIVAAAGRIVDGESRASHSTSSGAPTTLASLPGNTVKRGADTAS